MVRTAHPTGYGRFDWGRSAPRARLNFHIAPARRSVYPSSPLPPVIPSPSGRGLGRAKRGAGDKNHTAVLYPLILAFSLREKGSLFVLLGIVRIVLQTKSTHLLGAKRVRDYR